MRIPVSVCGEMAGDERAIPIWLELGVKDLSMSPQSLLRVKHRILNTNAAEAKEATACFKLRTSSAVEERLSAFAERRYLNGTNGTDSTAS